MERMWRKVNQGLRSNKSQSDTASSAGFGGENQIQVVAVSGAINNNNIASSSSNNNNNNGVSNNNQIGTYSGTAETGRRLASSGDQEMPGGMTTSFSQHILHQTTASSERRRRRRRKSRPRITKKSGDRLFQVFRNDSTQQPSVGQATTSTDPSLRQRAVAKFRMFNFHLNWDLHMTQCKPCGPRSGNILTRRLCRNRKREDNELYRSNSFKFERFERKENNENAGTLAKNISVCDDYSLPIDFVKKRPSSFDPCLAETLPDNWTIIAPSPLSDHVSFLDAPTLIKPNYPQQQPPPLPAQNNLNNNNINNSNFIITVQQNRVKLIEGYSDPKDSRKHHKIHYRRSRKDKRTNYTSDSSAPKSSEDEDNIHSPNKIPELNSPDSISEDLVHPLQTHKSPKKLSGLPEINKRNPSPYYYSDLLKSKAIEKEAKSQLRQSTASEPPLQLLLSTSCADLPQTAYRKSTSLDVPDIDRKDSCELSVDIQEQNHQKRYSITEDGVRIIRCHSPSTTTSDDSDCSECQQRREWHAKALALVRKTCNITALHPQHQHQQQPIHETQESGEHHLPELNTILSMPPHRLLGPAVCACTAPVVGDDVDEYFRPKSIFYVHPQGVHECADCIPAAKTSATDTIKTATNSSGKSNNSSTGNQRKLSKKQQEDEMSSGSRTRKLYETAFDSKIGRSDDDLDDVDRLTNHAVMLQLETSNNLKNKPPIERGKHSKSNKSSRLNGKRLKNSKNQAIQQDNGSISAISNDLENIHIENKDNNDQLNSTAIVSTLPILGFTPSPPSTAPLPVKFPAKHEHRMYINSIKSAPNLPSSNPAHPRLKDLRLSVHSLRQQQIHSKNLSNDSSIVVNSEITAQIDSNESLSRARDRPRSIVLASGRVLELRKSNNNDNNNHRNRHHHHHHHHDVNSHTETENNCVRRNNYSSTESMATSSSGGSMESIRSSTSEGNRSTTSSESRHSTSLSSHSSESGTSVSFPLRAPQLLLHSKLHILSPISDKSSLEPASDASELNKKLSPAQNGVITSNIIPENGVIKLGVPGGDGNSFITMATIEGQQQSGGQQHQQLNTGSCPKQFKKRIPPNKNLLQLTDEILGSDSGISLHSREDSKTHQSAFHRFGLPKPGFSNEKPTVDVMNAGSLCLPQDLRDLPFDMPKLRRRKIILQQDACTSGSATSVDLGDLPFDMPKLRRRLRLNQPQAQGNNKSLIGHSTESSGISQASSSHSVRDDQKNNALDVNIFRQNLTLNLNETKPQQKLSANNKFGSLDLRLGTTAAVTTTTSSSKGLNLNLNSTSGVFASAVDLIDVAVPLERQGWYHGAITRIEAETTLRPLNEGSFLVRNCESTKQDYSLSLKGAKGFMHMRIQRNDLNQYILGQFSRPFESIPEMIRHFCINRLPVRGAEHMCLLDPVIVQLL